MLTLDPVILELALGLFFLAMIPLRRWFATTGMRVTLLGLGCAGAAMGFLTGIVSNTGPINPPFFLAHGLTKGAFIGTEAMASLTMFLSKVTAIRSDGAMPIGLIWNGLIVGGSLMIGTYLAATYLRTMEENTFCGLMDGLLFVAGVAMISSALMS